MSCGGTIAWTGLIIIGSFVLYNMVENSDSAIKQRAEIERQRQEQAQQERRAKGIAACNRAANPPPEARAPRDAADAINDLSSTLDGITAKLDVSNIQHNLDEATLAGNAGLANKLRGDLETAKRAQADKDADNARRRAISEAHEQALQDIADCRQFRGEE